MTENLEVDIEFCAQDCVLERLQTNTSRDLIVSIQDEEGAPVDFGDVDSNQILRLYFLDVDEVGEPGPCQQHIEQLDEALCGLLDSGRNKVHILVHCFLGKSRSSAVALIILRRCGYTMQAALSVIQQQSPYCEPNQALLQLAGYAQI